VGCAKFVVSRLYERISRACKQIDENMREKVKSHLKQLEANFDPAQKDVVMVVALALSLISLVLFVMQRSWSSSHSEVTIWVFLSLTRFNQNYNLRSQEDYCYTEGKFLRDGVCSLHMQSFLFAPNRRKYDKKKSFTAPLPECVQACLS
jgi:hypothetical protein